MCKSCWSQLDSTVPSSNHNNSVFDIKNLEQMKQSASCCIFPVIIIILQTILFAKRAASGVTASIPHQSCTNMTVAKDLPLAGLGRSCCKWQFKQ